MNLKLDENKRNNQLSPSHYMRRRSSCLEDSSSDEAEQLLSTFRASSPRRLRRVSRDRSPIDKKILQTSNSVPKSPNAQIKPSSSYSIITINETVKAADEFIPKDSLNDEPSERKIFQGFPYYSEHTSPDGDDEEEIDTTYFTKNFIGKTFKTDVCKLFIFILI